MTDRYENIRKALAMGPTKGPWKVDPENTPPRSIDSAAGGDVLYGCGCCGSPNMSVEDAAHIAACDPDTIRALLKERDVLLGAARIAATMRLSDWLNAGGTVADFDMIAAIDQARGKACGEVEGG